MKSILKVIISVSLLLTIFIPLASNQTQAASTQIGTIDISSGKLNVRNAANTKAKVIGSLKKSDKVQVYSQSNTWTKIQYGKSIGYISSDYVRFYKTTSSYSVKQITDRILAAERNMWTKIFTKQQFYNMMLSYFTKEYTDLYFKHEIWSVGKNSKGISLYEVIPTEIGGLSIDEIDWYLKYETEKPSITFYTKKGVSYLVVSQFHDSELSSYTTSLYLVKKPKDNWKVYSIARDYPNYQ